MKVIVQLTDQPIIKSVSTIVPSLETGSVIDFYGIVRGEEGGSSIMALRYEAYSEMALTEMRRIATTLGVQFPCQEIFVIHRYGIIPVGEVAIHVSIASKHRAEGNSLLDAFMKQLKLDVPIWKIEGIPLYD